MASIGTGVERTKGNGIASPEFSIRAFDQGGPVTSGGDEILTGSENGVEMIGKKVGAERNLRSGGASCYCGGHRFSGGGANRRGAKASC